VAVVARADVKVLGYPRINVSVRSNDLCYFEGRDIWALKISDNPTIDEPSEPDILYMGAHHGNEWPSFEILIYFINHMVDFYYKLNTDDDFDGQLNEDPIDGFDNDDDGLTDEDPSEDRVRDSMNNTQIFLIPMLNYPYLLHQFIQLLMKKMNNYSLI